MTTPIKNHGSILFRVPCKLCGIILSGMSVIDNYLRASAYMHHDCWRGFPELATKTRNGSDFFNAPISKDEMVAYNSIVATCARRSSESLNQYMARWTNKGEGSYAKSAKADGLDMDSPLERDTATRDIYGAPIKPAEFFMDTEPIRIRIYEQCVYDRCKLCRLKLNTLPIANYPTLACCGMHSSCWNAFVELGKSEVICRLGGEKLKWNLSDEQKREYVSLIDSLARRPGESVGLYMKRWTNEKEKGWITKEFLDALHHAQITLNYNQ